MADDAFKIRVDGAEYSIDDFEGRDLVDVERQLDISLSRELERWSTTGIYALVYLVKHKNDARVTLDEVLSMNMGEVGRAVSGPEDDEAEKTGPTPAAPKAKRAG
jgi:hypothetical protein